MYIYIYIYVLFLFNFTLFDFITVTTFLIELQRDVVCIAFWNVTFIRLALVRLRPPKVSRNPDISFVFLYFLILFSFLCFIFSFFEVYHGRAGDNLVRSSSLSLSIPACTNLLLSHRQLIFEHNSRIHDNTDELDSLWGSSVKLGTIQKTILMTIQTSCGIIPQSEKYGNNSSSLSLSLEDTTKVYHRWNRNPRPQPQSNLVFLTQLSSYYIFLNWLFGALVGVGGSDFVGY